MHFRSSVAFLVLMIVPTAFSQGGPPPPGPVPPPPVPPGNPITTAKANLGKVLFWDEQLSSSRTVACGTCHIPTKGGSDPRSFVGSPVSTHPGLDALFGTPDDVTGSIGVVRHTAPGPFVNVAPFELARQVTNRKAPSMIFAAYSPRLFWDGRANPSFQDPITGSTTLLANAALESQAVGPPVSDVEMGHIDRDWADVLARLLVARPLALSPQLPPALEAWIADRSYPELFQEAFGSPALNPSRVAMAIATYERTLIANQSPFDAFLAGVPGALTPQQNAGRNVFLGPGNCVPCHGGNLQTDHLFHNNGVRPIAEDLGRGAITGNPGDNGRFRTPTLRNVALRGPYFHNGGFQTLLQVVEFYDRGGDFFVNQDPAINPLGLTPQQKTDLVAFLGALTDPRVAAGLPPFDRPVLYSESDLVPDHFGTGSPGAGGFTPRFVAFEPAVIGSPNFTFGIADARGGAPAFLALDVARSLPGTIVSGLPFHLAGSFAFTVLPLGVTAGTGDGNGWLSVTSALPPSPGLPGFELVMQAFLADPAGVSGFAATEGLELEFFTSN